MRVETFKRCLDKVPPEVTIIFSGFSEPWLANRCAEMVQYAFHRGHKIKIYTTLIGMKETDIMILEKIPFKSFCVHLPSNDTSNTIPVNKKYMHILEKIMNSRIKPGFIVIGKEQHKKLRYLKIKNIGCNPGHSRANNISTGEIVSSKRKRGKIQCSVSVGNNFTLLPNGDVALCCMDYSLSHIMGNLLKDDFQSLFKNEQYGKIQAAFEDEKVEIICRYCKWSKKKT